ncbi:histidine phosphatase family protein [Nocardioides ferulae]|uniref:histidine phosphatase family protein n=1 Tax=Nocardioides ferulae TaxID=2340821 RepID=UPI000EB313C0|nr:histidine phosphatase family protein [Nocardioides ferulae]
MRLLLIRHGQTPNNVVGALDTAFPGAGLTPLGLAQAAAVPVALAGEQVAGVYASPLVRTQLTGAPLAEARGLDLTVLAGLEEISAADLEMRSDDEAVHAYAGCVGHWVCGDLDRRMPGGCSGHEFFSRYDAAVRSLAARHGRDDTVAVFSHGAAIRAYTALATSLEPEVAAELHIMNTGMGVLEGSPDEGWSLAGWSREPLGGLDLEDPSAHDVTGESAEEAAH